MTNLLTKERISGYDRMPHRERYDKRQHERDATAYGGLAGRYRLVVTHRSIESETTTAPAPRPWLGKRVGAWADALWLWIEAEPERLMRWALNVALALSTLAAVLAGFGSGASVFAAAALLIVWGGAGVLSFAVTGKQIIDPRLSFLLLVVGVGSLIVAVVAALS